MAEQNVNDAASLAIGGGELDKAGYWERVLDASVDGAEWAYEQVEFAADQAYGAAKELLGVGDSDATFFYANADAPPVLGFGQDGNPLPSQLSYSNWTPVPGAESAEQAVAILKESGELQGWGAIAGPDGISQLAAGQSLELPFDPSAVLVTVPPEALLAMGGTVVIGLVVGYATVRVIDWVTDSQPLGASQQRDNYFWPVPER